MPRKRKASAEAANVAEMPSPTVTNAPQAEGPHGLEGPVQMETPQRQWARSFKSLLTLPGKGATIGVRVGHDWVIGFPDDPGPAIKEKLGDAGFTYRSRDRKWTTFTHAPNRHRVEALARSLKAECGDEVSVNDYPVNQVVLAFAENPGEEATAQLREREFRYRSDQTWNADYSPQAMDFAREFVKGLPDRPRQLGDA